jgi:hypothetical protein
MKQKAQETEQLRLELDFIEILRGRKRWNIYMIIATENPENPEETMITALPSLPIRLRKMDDNRADFEPEGSGETHGLFVLERSMPSDRSLRTRMWLVQSRKNSRKSGEVLAKLSDMVQSEAGDLLSDSLGQLLGSGNPWIAVGKSIVWITGLIGEFLKASRDRNLGFIGMDEHFTEEEIEQGEVDRVGFVTSVGKAGWTWVVEKPGALLA